MTIYTVLAPPLRSGDIAPDPQALVFVKEGFNWPALFIPEIWLIARRMWLVVVLDIAAIALASILLDGVALIAGLVVVQLARFLFALEANGLRRWTYYRHGYKLLDVVEGQRLSEAELRFYLDWAPEIAAPTPPAESEPPQPKPRSLEAGDVVGLFPTRGGTA